MVYSPIDIARTEKRKVIGKRQIKTPEWAKHESKLAQRLQDTKTQKATLVYSNKDVIRSSFIVMAELAGQDFTETICTNSYTISQLIQLSISALKDLKKIDDAGIIQRDIKPDNMKVDHDQMSVRIFDFGLAREKELPDNRRCGTFQWMSPEMMAVPKLADAESDIFSMGIVLRIFWDDNEAFRDCSMGREELNAKRSKQYTDDSVAILDLDNRLIQKWRMGLSMCRKKSA